jgi:hypothetical protein
MGILRRRNGEAHIGSEVMEMRVKGYEKERETVNKVEKDVRNGYMKENSLLVVVDEDMTINRKP